MNQIKTHYQNLQVAENASIEVIKAAYRTLTQKWHPDKNPDRKEESERNSKIINAAYAVLSDPIQRREHDQWIAERREHDAKARAEVESAAHKETEAAAARSAEAAARSQAKAAARKHARETAQEQAEATARTEAEAARRRHDAQQSSSASASQPTNAIKHVGLQWDAIWLWMAAIVGIFYWGIARLGNPTSIALVDAVLLAVGSVCVIWFIASIITDIFKHRFPRAFGVLVTTTLMAALFSYVTNFVVEAVQPAAPTSLQVADVPSPVEPAGAALDVVTHARIEIAPGASFVLKDFRITPLAKMELTARVLSRADYSYDAGSSISPTDLALGWGRMADSAILARLDIRQSVRWYAYRWGPEGPPIPPDEIIRSSTIMHIVPADDQVGTALRGVRPGDTIHMTGLLIEAEGKDGGVWRSSVSLSDTGEGGGKLIWLQALDEVQIHEQTQIAAPTSRPTAENDGRGADADQQRSQLPTNRRTDYAAALAEYRPRADAGDANAQTDLGEMYVQGHGVPQSYANALVWYRKAAAQGQLYAQNHIAVMYSQGHGVRQDPVEALVWYRKAANQGLAAAQWSMGTAFYDGIGVPKNYFQAIGWFRKAAAQGDAAGENALGWMYRRGFGVAQDYAVALEWFRKGAEQGNADAQEDLGEMYDHGEGVAKDDAAAMKWLRKAAAQGNGDAQKYIQRMNDRKSGTEIPRPVERAQPAD